MPRTALPPTPLLRYGALLRIPLRPAALVTLIVLSGTLTVASMANAFGVPLPASPCRRCCRWRWFSAPGASGDPCCR